MSTFGRTALGDTEDELPGGNGATTAAIAIMDFATVADAPIDVSKITVYGENTFGGTNGYIKGLLVAATDLGSGAFSVGTVYGYTDAVTWDPALPIGNFDLPASTPIYIPSNSVVGIGYIAYSDLGSDYAWPGFSRLTLNTTGTQKTYVSSGSIHDFNSPPADLTGLMTTAFAGSLTDWTAWATYTASGGGGGGGGSFNPAVLGGYHP